MPVRNKSSARTGYQILYQSHFTSAKQLPNQCNIYQCDTVAKPVHHVPVQKSCQTIATFFHIAKFQKQF